MANKQYEKEIYITGRDNKIRYVLGKFTDNPLVVFGINPSRASAEKNDTTISIVENIAEMRPHFLSLLFYPST